MVNFNNHKVTALPHLFEENNQTQQTPEAFIP